MEKFADDIHKIIQEKLLIYKTLKRVLEQEKRCLADVDIDFLWDIAERKKQLANDIQGLRERIFLLLDEQGVPVKKDAKAFDLLHVIKKSPLPVNLKNDLKKSKTKLDVLKKEISEIASENRRYVNEHLSVIEGIFTTILNSDNLDQYNSTGSIPKSSSTKSLIKAEV